MIEQKTDQLHALEQRYMLNLFARPPMALVRGEGVKVWDDSGRMYLDFVGGIACSPLGHAHPVVVKAISEQAAKLIQVSNLYFNEPQLELAEWLAKHSSMQRAFFVNSGAEANETAIKLARKYGKQNRGKSTGEDGRYEIISMLGGFHGRTLATVAATGKPHYQKPFSPMPPGFINVAFNDIEAVKQATNERTVAIMLELIQGEAGINPVSQEYAKAIRAWCDENDLLLIIDEVQTGVGRTGTLWVYEQYGIQPDIMTLAKGLAGGVPIGATLATDKAAVFVPGEHGSTFGGNPLACATAIAVLNTIVEQNLPQQAMRLGGYLTRKIEALREKYPLIKEVRGKGLMIGVGLNGDHSAKVASEAMERGLLINPVNPSTLRMVPALILTEAEADQAVEILDQALAAVGTPEATPSNGH